MGQDKDSGASPSAILLSLLFYLLKSVGVAVQLTVAAGGGEML